MGQGNEELLRFAPDSPWAAIYDMEAMFPDRKAQPEPAPPADDHVCHMVLRVGCQLQFLRAFRNKCVFQLDLSKVKVDVEELRTLSALGIDVDFLQDMEEELAAAQHDYGISAALTHTYQLILKLEKEQRERYTLYFIIKLALFLIFFIFLLNFLV